MKIKAVILSAVASYLLFIAPTYARQQQEQQKGNPSQEEGKKHQDKAQKGEQGEQGEQQQPDAKQEQKQRQATEKAQQNQDRQEKKEEKQRPPSHEQQPQTESQSQTRTRTEAHVRIPEERFHASFGREHHFHVRHVSDNRFQYEGFWFVLGEPWPVDWDYDADDCYIDEIGEEYYLFDVRHPGVRIEVFVVE